MLKGVTKEIIEINNTKNPYFEKVILIVNPGKNYILSKHKEYEAKRLINKLLEENSQQEKIGLLKRFKSPFFAFIKMGIAAVLGAFIVFLLKF